VLFKEDDKFDESAALVNLIETYGQVKEAVTLTESGQKKRKGVDKDAEGATVTTADDKDEKDEKVKKVKASETVAVRIFPLFPER
jgi:cation transport ATPase